MEIIENGCNTENMSSESEHEEQREEYTDQSKVSGKTAFMNSVLLGISVFFIIEIISEFGQTFGQILVKVGAFGGIGSTVIAAIYKSVFADSQNSLWRPREEKVSLCEDIMRIVKTLFRNLSKSTMTIMLFMLWFIVVMAQIAANKHMTARLCAGVKAGVDAFVSFEEKDPEEKDQEEEDPEEENILLIKRS